MKKINPLEFLLLMVDIRHYEYPKRKNYALKMYKYSNKLGYCNPALIVFLLKLRA